MLYGNRPEDTRQLFFSSWEKYQNKQMLTPLESQIVAVIQGHPEYHAMLKDKDGTVLSGVSHNPFLHMGLHLAVRDQISMDRPHGMRDIYEQLFSQKQDRMMVEHLMMDCLEAALWQAQQNGGAPNEAAYLASCRRLLFLSR